MAAELLAVGLGNPGPRYQGNRHNFGFMVVDALASKRGEPSWQHKFGGLHCRARVAGRHVNLLKPQTYMNLSGESVSRAAAFYKINPSEVIVIYDDLDLPFGNLRIRRGGGTGGHNGIESVIEELGKPGFVRVRMGIGRPLRNEDTHATDVTNYVLADFSTEERKSLTNVIDRGAKAVERVIRSGVTAAMNQFNKRGGEADES